VIISLTLPFLFLSAAADKDAATAPESTIFSNTEEVYFDGEADRDPAPLLTVKQSGETFEFIDPFGKPLAKAPTAKILRELDNALIVQAGDKVSVLRKSNPVTCWAAVRKDKPKPDGSADWHFQSGIKSFDEGGHFRVGGGDTGAAEAVIRMRSVRWPKPSTNRPAKVIYIHKPDDLVKAVSYSWADVNAASVGINLRWIQASCTIDGSRQRSKVTARNFRG